MAAFVPADFVPVEKVETAEFVVRKLMAHNVYIDYIAVMSSIETIRRLRGGSWPTPELTIEDDLIDLGWHQREFEAKSSFAYTVTNVAGDTCVGCVYFYPPDAPMNSAKKDTPADADVVVNMWVATEAYEAGLYPKLWRFVEEWVAKDWPFQKPFFSNPVKP